MRRTLAALLFVVLLSVPPGVAAAAVPDARLTVSGLSVAPDTPTTGEPVTVTATVRNSPASPSAATVEAVRLVNGTATLAEATRPGSLSQGDTLTVDLTAAFSTAGRRDLRVEVVGTDADGDRVTVARPVTFTVEQAPPQVELRVEDPVAGARTRVAVTVSNPTTAPVRNLEVGLNASDPVVGRRTLPALAAGTSTTLNLSYRPEEGRARLGVAVEYTTSTGTRGRTVRGVPVRAPPLETDVGVAVTPVRGQAPRAAAGGQLGGLLGGGPTAGSGALRPSEEEDGPPSRVEVTVTNFGNAPLRDVVVAPRAGNRSLPRVAVGTVPPGETGTAEVDLSSVEQPATVTAVARYGTAGTRGRATGSFEYEPPTGAVRVTDVDLAFTDAGTLRITGNAGNVGTGEVTGVVVTVGRSAHVAPAYPKRSFFVGTVEGSEFAPFELTARVDPRNATGVPIRVTYVVDGERRTLERTLPYDSSLAPEAGGGSLRLGGFAAVGAAALAVALPAALYAAYRRR